MTKIPECEVCDFENALRRGRATWVCPDCGRDFSLEYLFWLEATHPEEAVSKESPSTIEKDK